MKKALALALFAMIAAPMFASVELNTSISDVYHRGSNELAGSISFNVTTDDFEDASTTEPVYIRITTDRNSTLAETLVDQSLVSTNYKSMPIHLAMRLISANPAISMVADLEAVSIVRWVRGESSIWVRVQQTSDDWLNNGVNIGPSEEAQVEWTLGISARVSDEANDTADNSNLPYNTRETASAAELDYDHATSTLICVDLSNSNLESDGTDNSLLKFDIISYDEEADIGGGDYSGNAGNQNSINFTNDFTIARGRSRQCDATEWVPAKSVAGTSDLCINFAGSNSSSQEYVWLDHDLTIHITCDDANSNTLETRIYNGTYVQFETPSDSRYGFNTTQGAVPAFTNRTGVDDLPLSGSPSMVGGSFSNNGLTLYRTARVTYNGSDDYLVTSGGRLVSVNVRVMQHYTDPAVTATADWDVVLFDHDGQKDDAPYDGNDGFDDGDDADSLDNEDQDRRCAPSAIWIDGETFTIGDFVVCTGDAVSLFFPYLPRIVGNSDFWVGLSYVNQGNVALDVTAHIYDEDGNLFAADLGRIGTRELRTWLLSDVAGQATFTGAGDNNADESIIPESADPVVGADTLGTTRSSMFVVGSFETLFFEEQSAGDLDGYMLVGNMSTNSIDGAYLPRNWDVDGGQAADLPLNRSKK